MMKRRLSPRPSSPPSDTPTATKRSRADRSIANRFMKLMKAGADARLTKVKRIRQSVRTLTYENDLKLSIALDRMTRDLTD